MRRTVITCDRCGSQLDNHRHVQWLVVGIGPSLPLKETSAKELCPECGKALWAFLGVEAPQ